MANNIIRPAELPPRANPIASEIVPSDNGVSVAAVTWADGVNAGRPLANQVEAEAGVNATKAMTPLTVNQHVTARIGVDLASKAQGDKADTAVQPNELATVATTGDYDDLSNKPTLGTAAATDSGDYATAAQGAKADTAVQPNELATVATTGDYDDLSNKPTLGTAAATDSGDYATAAQGAKADTALQSIVAGVSAAVDNTDPLNPVISFTGIGSNAFVTTRAALAALDTTTVTAAYLKEAGREGQFLWRSGDYSSLVAIDTAEGVYIKADAVSASTGAWVRVFDGFTFDILWFGAVANSSNSADMNANVAAFNIIHDLAQSRALIILPYGLLHVNQTIEITKAISIHGKTKLGSGLYAVGFNTDDTVLDYQGTIISPIQNIELRDFGLWSDGNTARGLTLTRVNKSSFEHLYLFDLYRGVYGSYAWSDSWKNISTYNITKETFLFGDECNNSNFDRVEFSGSSGLKITGHCAGFTFTGCDFENITDANGAALELVPTSGKFISGVSLSGCYFERIKGVGIRCAGADARSVRGLSVQGCSIYGGSTDFFSGAAGQAEYGIVLHNVSGFMITGNTFDDWRSACIFRDDTERDGRVENNTISRTPDLTNSAGSVNGSVVVRNNFSTTNGVYLGRREEWGNSVPTSGTYRAGDVVWVRGAPTVDANGMVLLGWARMTSGSDHAVGTDWARLYASHVSPAN